MKATFIATSIMCLAGACICHVKTGDSTLQIAMRYLIDAILFILWLKSAIRWRALVAKEKVLRKMTDSIRAREDRLRREIDDIMSASLEVIGRNQVVFGR